MLNTLRCIGNIATDDYPCGTSDGRVMFDRFSPRPVHFLIANPVFNFPKLFGHQVKVIFAASCKFISIVPHFM